MTSVSTQNVTVTLERAGPSQNCLPATEGRFAEAAIAQRSRLAAAELSPFESIRTLAVNRIMYHGSVSALGHAPNPHGVAKIDLGAARFCVRVGGPEAERWRWNSALPAGSARRRTATMSPKAEAEFLREALHWMPVCSMNRMRTTSLPWFVIVTGPSLG
jgi:hypothetical protein